MSLKPNALTTLATAKSHLSISPSDALQDVRLELLINAASEKIERYTNRILVSQGTIAELQHGRRENILLLKQWPIIAISAVSVDYTAVHTAPANVLAASDYAISDDLNSVLLINQTFPVGFNNIKITYTAGYVTVPSDLELACLWLVEWYYLMRTRGDMGRTTASKGGESVGVLDHMPPMISEMLEYYKRTEFAAINSPIRNH
jgi:uncharacterized phiE125 gp8 family phage protein